MRVHLRVRFFSVHDKIMAKSKYETYRSIKVITITGLIILGIVLDLGGGPNHDRLGMTRILWFRDTKLTDARLQILETSRTFCPIRRYRWSQRVCFILARFVIFMVILSRQSISGLGEILKGYASPHNLIHVLVGCDDAGRVLFHRNWNCCRE